MSMKMAVLTPGTKTFNTNLVFFLVESILAEAAKHTLWIFEALVHLVS